MAKSQFPQVEIPECSLSEFLFARLDAQRPAFIEGLTGRQITYGDLWSQVQSLAAHLVELGLQKGDRVAVLAPNSIDYVLAWQATVLAGGVVTGINPSYTREEVAYQVEDAGVLFIFATPELAHLCPPVDHLLLLPCHVPSRAFSPPPVRSALDLAAVPFSSGTSGRPKGVMLTHRNLVAMLLQVEAVLGNRPGDAVLAVLPFFHIFGMQVLMNHVIARGLTSIILPRFEMERALALIQEHRISHFFLVPPIVVGLARHPAVDHYDLSSLRYIMSGAAPLDAGIQAAASERLGVAVLQGYGMTETSLAVAVMPQGSRHPGSSGWLLPNVEVILRCPETGQSLPDGERGEIHVCGPNVMAGYLNHQEATRECLSEGWLRTGDIGYFDEAGHLFVVDRVKELIKYKGFQVAPAEVEGVLLTHPAVADCAVIGVPDLEAGEVPKAFVVPRGPVNLADLQEFCRQHLCHHKQIRQLEMVESIPRSAAGKALRRLLRN
ncbi:MAG: AMP-binding protein [Vulcanimicrobiota bacterium]